MAIERRDIYRCDCCGQVISKPTATQYGNVNFGIGVGGELIGVEVNARVTGVPVSTLICEECALSAMIEIVGKHRKSDSVSLTERMRLIKSDTK